MLAETAKIISIVFLTMLKFIFGPTLGYGAGFPFIITVFITIAGMMASVFLFTYLGTYISENWLNRFFKNKKTFTKRNRKFITIWKKYGIKGVAFLTPIVLTPIGGTLLLTTYHTPRKMIIIYMLISAICWSLILSGIVYFAGDTFKSFIPQDPHPEVFLYLE
jgi:membrane protein DedA with SNARE-associated domain